MKKNQSPNVTQQGTGLKPQKLIIQFLGSIVILPSLTISQSNINTNLLISLKNTENTVLVSPSGLNATVIDDNSNYELNATVNKAQIIDAYFEARKMPLAGTGLKMVQEAQKNKLDWRLLPAIAIRESTGGKFACKTVKYNPFGWGSCKFGFESNENAIEIIAKNLGGNNPKTAFYYTGKDTAGILKSYNPPSVIPKYVEQVISIMDNIGEI
ncbi:MAG: hypothetical protein AAB693_02790 [Patescibacteria group bacterium]